MFRSSKKVAVGRRSVSVAASSLIEGLELRSMFSAAPIAITAATITPRADQGEIVQADFTAGNSVTGWTINWGDGSNSHLAANRSHATHLYSNVGVYAATIAAAVPGTDPTPATVAYTIDNVDPDVAVTGLPTSAVEGSAISLGSAVNDAGAASGRIYGWTLYRDGKHYIVPDGTDITSQTFTFTPADNGNYVARLTVLDGQGGITSVKSTPIVVANAAPTGFIGGVPPSVMNDGRTIYLGAHAADAGRDDTLTYAWTLSRNGSPVDLGDPTTKNQTLVSLDDGTYVAKCVVTDNDGAATTLTATFDVLRALPTTSVSIGGISPSGDEGTAVNAYATVFGPDAADAQTYEWTVTKDSRAYTLPDGTNVSDPSFSFTPADNGEYVVSLTVTDSNGILGETSSAITVANVAPTVTLAGELSGTINAGSEVYLTTTLTDPGTTDGHWFEWAISKDGQPWTPPVETRLDSNGLVFTPSDAGTYVATVTVHDLDGGESSTSSLPIVVGFPSIGQISGVNV